MNNLNQMKIWIKFLFFFIGKLQLLCIFTFKEKKFNFYLFNK